MQQYLEIFGALVLVGGWVYQSGRSSAVLDRLARAVDKLAAAHTDTTTTVARHGERIDAHEKRLDGHDDDLRTFREITR